MRSHPSVPWYTAEIGCCFPDIRTFSRQLEGSDCFPSFNLPGLLSDFKNLRPTDNLQYVSKLTERAVFEQMHAHVTKHGLYPTLQSAHCKCHSTKRALLKAQNDILMNMDSQRVTLLVLLDLSAAFDTVDQGGLLNRLKSSFGIR